MAQAEAIDPIERAKRKNALEHPRQRDAEDRIVERPYDKWSNGLKYGAIAGVLVGIYQLVLNLTEDGIHISYGILGFFLMAPVIWYALREYHRDYAAAGEFFKNAAILTMYISAVAGVISGIMSMVGSEIMSVEGADVFQLAVNAFFQIVIGVVIGNTIGFILMQGMKTDAPADEFVEVNDKTNA